MAQPVLVGKDEGCRLNLVNPDGSPMVAPPGHAVCSLSSVSVWMSPDGQEVRFTAPTTAGVTFSLTWKDDRGPSPAGVDDCSINIVTRNIIASLGPPVQLN